MGVNHRLIGLAVVLCSTHSQALPQANTALCQQWSRPESIGNLDPLVINESSGLALSHVFSGRLYHVNDSGDGPYVYWTDRKGESLHRIEIEAYDPVDAEDLASGFCRGSVPCLVSADTGDNDKDRDSVQIVAVDESQLSNSKAAPLYHVFAKYPDGPHDVEGMALHPNGDLYFFTKEFDGKKKIAYPTEVFRLRKSEWQVASGATRTLEHVGSIDLPEIARSQHFWGEIVTGADISPDGDRLLLMTYMDAVEFSVDLSRAPKGFRIGVSDTSNYHAIPLASLPQQESIVYDQDGHSLLFATESVENGPAPIMRSRCLD